MVYAHLNIEDYIKKLNEDELVNLGLFEKIDIVIIKWLVERLENEDVLAKLDGNTILEVCFMRRKMHYGLIYYSHYYILENAYYIIKAKHFEAKKDLNDIYMDYINKDYIIDQKYRYFYYHYDKVLNNAPYEKLSNLVENIYVNKFLNPLCINWSNELNKNNFNTRISKQQDFYYKYIKNSKGRVVVVISDALRFEVGKTLVKKFMEDEKCKVDIEGIQGIVPSYTSLGMAALLPHKNISLDKNYNTFVDNMPCNDLKSREKILKTYNENSKVMQFDEVKTTKEARNLTTGQEVVYIYHNQIDARGDKLNTENEVFTACEEAVDEIYKMVKRLTSANNTHFIITADHGFIYKRVKINESEKISGFEKNNAFIGKRYIISDEKVDKDGVYNVELKKSTSK